MIKMQRKEPLELSKEKKLHCDLNNELFILSSIRLLKYLTVKSDKRRIIVIKFNLYFL